MSIKWKITVLFLLLAGTPLFIGWIFKGQYQSLVQRNALARLEAVASNLEERMDLVHQLNQERLAGITSRTQLRLSLSRYLEAEEPGAIQMMRLIIGDALSSIPTFQRIDILSTNGNPILTTGDEIEAVIHALVRDAEQQNFRHAELRETPDGEWKLLMMGPLSLNDEVIGVAVLHSDISDILAQADRDAYLENSGAVLLAVHGDDGSPQLIRAPAASEQSDFDTLNSVLPFVDAVQAKENTYTDIKDYRGIPVLAATRYAEPLGLGMVVKIDRDEVFGPLQRVQQRQLWLTLVALIPLFALAFWIAWSVYRPVKRLVEGTDIVGAGDLGYRTNSTARDEMGDLARAFDVMLDRLNKANQKLVDSRNDLEHFTHIAAHDLREPLRQNRSLLDLFMLAVQRNDREKTQTLSNHLFANTDKMLHMIDHFRLLTKIGYRELSRETVNPKTLIDSVIHDLNGQLRAREVDIRFDPHPDEVRLYRSLVTLLYTNLVQNALDHTLGDEFQLHFTAHRSDGHWVFGVCNTLSSIRPDDQTRIFQMFRTGKHETGSGVGLSICKTVVDRHQGRIWVESGPDITWFQFTLEGA